jgi:hypothetical protein
LEYIVHTKELKQLLKASLTANLPVAGGFIYFGNPVTSPDPVITIHVDDEHFHIAQQRSAKGKRAIKSFARKESEIDVCIDFIEKRIVVLQQELRDSGVSEEVIADQDFYAL